MRLGVVLEAFVDRTLADTLELLSATAPDVTALEVGVGGFAPVPHCDVERLLRDDAARRAWLQTIEEPGFTVAGLNVSGNPLDPDPAIAERHDTDLHNAVLLAAALGVDRVVAMAGCPPGAEGDRTPHFDGGGWLPYLAGVGERQWQDFVLPYWTELGEFARREYPELLLCLELHPGTFAHNTETFERLATVSDNIAANLDPSHLFWQRMDPIRVAETLSRIGHAHAKDVVFNDDELARNGLLDPRWRPTDAAAPWTFATVGRGHETEWWRSFVRTIASRGVETIAIEHEDPTMPAERGIVEAAGVLTAALPLEVT